MTSPFFFSSTFVSTSVLFFRILLFPFFSKALIFLFPSFLLFFLLFLMYFSLFFYFLCSPLFTFLFFLKLCCFSFPPLFSFFFIFVFLNSSSLLCIFSFHVSSFRVLPLFFSFSLFLSFLLIVFLFHCLFNIVLSPPPLFSVLNVLLFLFCRFFLFFCLISSLFLSFCRLFQSLLFSVSSFASFPSSPPFSSFCFRL